jgi:non-canonical purine NTP pyrophosphatase (RdgB/HAM1 family)
MKTFVFVTQSSDKTKEAERILGVKLHRRNIDLPEIQAIDVEDVVVYKAKKAFKFLREPVIIEDTGLFIEAWNGLPGALIKWYLQRVGTEGICKMLQQFPNRLARAKTIVATYDGIDEPHTFIGEINGQISMTPIGNQGFGWDSIFIPDGALKTFGEMPPAEKDRFSMRRLAFEAMKNFYTLKN